MHQYIVDIIPYMVKYAPTRARVVAAAAPSGIEALLLSMLRTS
jgi:hypothetical protein